MRAVARGDTSRMIAQQFESGFWFKQDLTFVNIRRVLADMTLLGVRIYEFDGDLRLRNVSVAESGRFTGNGQWQLENVRKTEIGPEQTRVTTAPTVVWETVLRPSILTVYQVAPERLDLNALYDNISILAGKAQKTSRFEIAFWNKIFYPAAVLVMMFLALPFAHFQRRQGGIGFRIFAGTMLGLAFFMLGRLFSNLGVLNDWPPLFSAVFPLVVFVAVAGGMMWYIERR
jgi:lipopolysaccharide export system permease protein